MKAQEGQEEDFEKKKKGGVGISFVSEGYTEPRRRKGEGVGELTATNWGLNNIFQPSFILHSRQRVIGALSVKFIRLYNSFALRKGKAGGQRSNRFCVLALPCELFFTERGDQCLLRLKKLKGLCNENG